MSTTKHNNLLPSNWSKTSKMRQEKIAKRLAKNGSKAKNVDMDAIRARRSRLEELTKSMKSPNTDKRTSRAGSGAARKDVKLTPIRTTSLNRLGQKKEKDPLLRKKSKPSPRTSSITSTKYEDELIEKWRQRRVLGNDVRRSSLRDDEEDSDEDYNQAMRKKDREEYEEYSVEQEESEQEDEDESSDYTNDEESEPSTERNDNPSPSEVENPSEKSIREIIRQMKARTEDERLLGVYKARRHLSLEEDPPFDQYIESGVVPPLVSCLSSYNPSLQFEAAWALTNLASGSTKHSMAIYEGGAIPELIILLESPYNRVSDQSVWAIGNLAGDGAFLWETVIDEGAIRPLYNLINKNTSLNSLRNLSWAFSNILRHKPLNLSPSDFSFCLKAARLFLHHPDKEIHLNACWSLVYLTDNGNEKIEEVLKAGVLPRVVEELLESNDKKTVAPAARAVGNIMTGTDDQTERVVSAGVIGPLARHLDHSSFTIRKDSAWALSNIMTGTESQIQGVIDAGVLYQLAVIIEKDEPRVRKEAIWCVSNLTQNGNREQVDDVVKTDLLEGLAASIPPHIPGGDKQLIHVALEGINNVLKKCCNKETAAEIILKHLQFSTLEHLTYDENKAIAGVAAKLHLLLSEYIDGT